MLNTITNEIGVIFFFFEKTFKHHPKNLLYDIITHFNNAEITHYHSRAAFVYERGPRPFDP